MYMRKFKRSIWDKHHPQLLSGYFSERIKKTSWKPLTISQKFLFKDFFMQYLESLLLFYLQGFHNVFWRIFLCYLAPPRPSLGHWQPHSPVHKKWSFLFRISSANVTKSVGNCSLVTFTEEILNGKVYFLCSAHDALHSLCLLHLT